MLDGKRKPCTCLTGKELGLEFCRGAASCLYDPMNYMKDLENRVAETRTRDTNRPTSPPPYPITSWTHDALVCFAAVLLGLGAAGFVIVIYSVLSAL